MSKSFKLAPITFSFGIFDKNGIFSSSLKWTIFFDLIERPDVPSHLECREISSRSVKLSWRRPFDGNSPVLSYIVQYQQIDSGQTQSAALSSEYNWSNPMNITLPNISVEKRYFYAFSMAICRCEESAWEQKWFTCFCSKKLL